jgi:putative ABC transport system permease protein
MIQNYLRLAYRNLQKRPGYTLLNLAGLALGMACCLAILQYVLYERSFDRFVRRADDVYRLRLDAYQKGEFAWKSATVYPAYVPTMLRDFPEVETACRLHDAEMLFANRERDIRFAEKKGYFADAAFLEIFELPLSAGKASEALSAPNQLVVSEQFAQKYFGTVDVVGRTLLASFNGMEQPMSITGTFQKFPENAHLIVDYVVSMPTLAQIVLMRGDTSRPLETSWGWYDFYSYLRLRKGADPAAFAAKLPAFTNKYINSEPRFAAADLRNETTLQPLTSIHLSSDLNQEAEPNGDGRTVGLLLAVALFILGIAWVNYLNLATARATERAREVGVRKVSGATRGQLMWQFLTESLLLNAAALVLAFGMVWAAQGLFADILGKKIPISVLTSAPLGWMLGIFTLGTLLSGAYPALVLSGFQPVSILKGAFQASPRGVVLRKSLIVGQFAMSVAMLVGLFVVTRQVKFMREQNPGFDRSQTLVLEGVRSLPDSSYRGIFPGFKNEALQIPGLRYLTGSTIVPGEEIYWTSGFRRMQSNDQQYNTLYIMGMDESFFPAYDLKVVAGRSFEPTDNDQSVMLNESAVRLLGFAGAEAAIGQYIQRGRRDTLTIRGVVRDFHQQGFQKTVDPICLRYGTNHRNYFSMKIAAGTSLPTAIASVGAAWKRHFPADPFSYFFLDEFFDRQYKADVQFGRVFGLFTAMAVFIACLGLFGLASYVVVQRTKEIGIRKVLGASVAGVAGLLAKDFLKLVLIAILVASPVAWYLLEKWLADFAYRIDMQWWMFAAAGAVAVAIATLTVGGQALRAALANPAKSLRSE